MAILLWFFVIWKVVDTLVSIFASYFIPYMGLFSYGKDMLVYGLPDFIRSLSNFDGIFYIRIALKGYSQYEQAFFPLYPLLIRLLTPVVSGNPIIAGLLISNAAFLAALLFLKRLLSFIGLKQSQIIWFIIFLLAYPASFFFGVIYTESLFLLLFVASLYFQKRENNTLAFIFAYLTGLTRIVGIFLFIPLFLNALRQFTQKKDSLASGFSKMLVVVGPILGLATYCLYLWRTTADPLFFFKAQEYFGAQRSTQLILLPQVFYRYGKILLTASKNFQYYVALIELIFFLFAFIILAYDLYRLLRTKKINFDRLGLNLFSLVNILLPTLTGTLISIPRFTLLSISIFIFLGQIKNIFIKAALLIIFIVLHIVIFSFFIQGYFVT